MRDACAPTGLLADYAAGTLSDGMRLLVGSHLAFCARCADRVARLEAVGGALFAGGPEATVEPCCLSRILARIANPCGSDRRSLDRELPAPLRLRLPAPVAALRWHAVRPGLTECRLAGFPSEAVGLMRADPGAGLRAPDHCGRESRLVLAGTLHDGDRTYRRGDLDLGRPGRVCDPEAAGSEPCLCLVVQPDPRTPAAPPLLLS